MKNNIDRLDNIEIILASKSPRRSELLNFIGINHTVKGTDFNEKDVTFDGNSVSDYVLTIAMGKCEEAIKSSNDRIILTADTVVFKDSRIFGKPKDRDEAHSFLKGLSGTHHEVITGICLYNGMNGKIVSEYDKTKVEVQNLSNDEIDWYIRSNEVYNVAGAYRIQGKFSRFIRSIEGSYHNVVGLPVNIVYNKLLEIL